MLVKKVNYFWKFGFLKSSRITKSIILVFYWVPRETNSRFCRKTQWQMFLLVSSCHVGDHLDGHQRGVSIQISINLGKKMYPHIFLKRNVCDLNLGEGFCICKFFLFPDSGLNILNGFAFYFDLFWTTWHRKPAILLQSNLPYVITQNVKPNWSLTGAWTISGQNFTSLTFGSWRDLPYV